jgi:subtilase family serine protease
MKRLVLLAGSALLLAVAVPLVGSTPLAVAGPRAVHVCRAARPGYAACMAVVRTNGGVRPAVSGAPAGYGPADLRSAYGLSAAVGSGRTVAIVDAYDDPTAERDLQHYRATYHLPPCTSASGCLRKVSQTGDRRALPKPDAGWASEISLDLDMVSATCPACHILLVEANSPAMADLAAAVNYAARQHVAAISNSYGGPDAAQRAAYDHPGIAITASAGDSGYGVASPASYRSVIGVGGTSLRRAATARGWAESAWSGSGSGCSSRNAKPTWQSATTGCAGKAVADVAAVADPNTGVAVYDTTALNGAAGWQVFGGTSAAAPIIAAVYAMSGRTAGYPASWTWAHAGSLNDVVAGSNGRCPVTAWCTARRGWDGPTGLGTPRGTAAF